MKNSTQIVVGLVLGSLVSVGIFGLLPEQKQEKVYAAMRRLNGSPVQKCIDKYKLQFKDPDSVVLVQGTVSIEGNRNRVLVAIKAKNGFGAYVNDVIGCQKIGSLMLPDYMTGN